MGYRVLYFLCFPGNKALVVLDNEKKVFQKLRHQVNKDLSADNLTSIKFHLTVSVFYFYHIIVGNSLSLTLLAYLLNFFSST